MDGMSYVVNFNVRQMFIMQNIFVQFHVTDKKKQKELKIRTTGDVNDDCKILLGRGK